MKEPVALKQTYIQFKTLKSKLDIRTSTIFMSFLLLNVLKISVFGELITNPASYFGSLFYRFFTLLAVALFIYLLLFNFKHRFPVIIFYILQEIYIFANLSYYLYFQNYLHLFQSWALFTEGLGAAGHFAVPRNPKLLLLLMDTPVFLYSVFTYEKIYNVILDLKILKRLLAFLCIAFILLTEGWNFLHKYALINFYKDYAGYEEIVVERYGTLANSAIDAWVNRNDKSLIDGIEYGKTISSGSAARSKPNFILIQVESMDSNIINKKYNGEYVMPFMEALSKECVYYPYALSYHKAGGTSDCEFSAFNSVEPLDNFPSMKISGYTYPNSFIRLLADNSYHTAAFHGNIYSYFSRNKAYPKLGFKEFYDMKRMELKDIGWGAPDLEVFRYARRQLENQSSPFIYHVITMSSHGPFTNASNYYHNSRYESIKDAVARDYFNSMSYVDQSLESFINYIRQRLENTYVIIFGDHTPGISNDTFRQASMNMDNKYFEFVPLMILTPDGQVRREEKITASFLDIAPTVLYSSGISFTFRSDGINLLGSESLHPIPYKGKSYDRSFLFSKISSK